MFNLVSKYKPSGDQPEAISELVQGLKEGKRDQVLLGATGTGKTFTIANVIGNFLRVAIQVPVLYKYGYKFKLFIDLKDERIKRGKLLPGHGLPQRAQCVER